jgi:hypothetical protein
MLAAGNGAGRVWFLTTDAEARAGGGGGGGGLDRAIDVTGSSACTLFKMAAPPASLGTIAATSGVAAVANAIAVCEMSAASDSLPSLSRNAPAETTTGPLARRGVECSPGGWTITPDVRAPLPP